MQPDTYNLVHEMLLKTDSGCACQPPSLTATTLAITVSFVQRR